MLLLLLVGGRSYAASCNYSAQTAIGKYAGALCFFDLSDYRDATASSAAGQDFTLTLPTGGTFSFNLKRTNGTASGGGTPNAPLAAVAMPSWGGASLGNNNWYAGVPGRPVLYQSSNRTTSILTFSNFVITRPDGTSFPNFDFIAIDGETTSAPTESFSLRTDGSAWREIDRSGSNITYSGLGTQDVSWRSPGGNASAPILQSHSPTQVVATLVGGGRQGMSFAIAATSLIVEKTVADPYGTGLGRARAGDQFALAVTNTSGATFDQQGQATTTGNASGKQTAKARALIYFSGSVNIGESMAAGSTSNVAAYDPTTTCVSTSGETTNLPVDQPGASVELTTLDPLHFDLVRCTITNTIPRPQVSIDKSSSAASVPPGGSLAYTITVTNTGEVPADGTVVRDDVPAGISTFNWTCDAEHGAVCPNGSGSGAINETIATLPPGGRIVYRIDAIVSWDPPSNIVNTSTADPPHGACYPNDSAPPCAATVTNTPAPVIGIGKRLDCDGSGGGGSSGGRGSGSGNGCGGGDGGGGARDGTSFNGAATVQEGAVPGSTVTYFLDVYNNSSVAADGTVVDDPIGPGLTTPFTWTCVAYGGAVCPNDSGSGAIHETLTTFPAWGWITYTITATVDANPPNPIVNRATAVPPAGGVCNSGIGGLLLGGEVEGSTPCEASVETPPAPQVAVSKSAEPSGALTPGGTVTYTITASNGGSVDAPNTHVVDEFPDGIAEATWTCTASGGAVCPADDSGGTVTPPATMLDQTIATFPPGSALTWTVTGTVNPDPPAQVVNTVSATPPDGGVCLPDNTPAPCDATVMNPPGPIVDIAKSADAGVVIPGGTVTYTVTVRNTGTVAADGTTLDDPLPTGIADATWTCSAEGGAVCPEASGTGAVAATITTFPPGGRLVYTIVATVDDNPPSPSVANTATITPPAGGVCDSSAPRPCDATTVLPVAPQIELTKTSEPAEAIPGGTLTWTVTVTNTGQADAAGTLIDDPVPSGIDSASVSWSCVASGGAVCPNASGSGGLNESVDTFPPGGRLVYTITAIVPAEPPTTIHNIAAATPPGEGRCMPGNTLPPCHADTATPSAANVSLAKAVADASGDGVAEPGETLTYTIVLSNSGGAAAVDYGVTDPLDANTTFVSASDGGVLSGGTVTWSGLSVPAGGTLTLTLVVTVNDPIPSGVAQIANLAYVTGETPPDCSVTPRPAGCTAIPTIGAVEIAKSVVDASGNGVAEPGETLTYTITLTNRGGSDVTGYGLLDPLDAHTTFVSASDGGALSGSTVSWSGLDIPAGASLSLTVVVTVNTPLPPGVTQIGNLAYQEGTVPPDCSAVPMPTSCTSIPTPGAIAIAKSVVDANGDGYAEAGEQLVYTIELTNVGGSEVTDYGVTDPLDANTTFVSASDGGLHSGGIVTWSGLTIAAGGSLTLNVVVTVNSPIPADVTQIFNLAYASGDAPPDCTAMPRPANCTDIFTIQFPAHVTIAKSASSDDLAPGAHVVYTVTVRNVGGSAATNVVVSDPIPAGIDAFAWTCAASGGAACPNAAGSGALAETIANLPGGGELVYTIDATIAADPPASVVNTAGVTLPDGTCSPCSSTVVGQVQVPSQIRPVPVADRWALWLLALLLAGFAGHGLVARRRRC
ncbi:hypothetical protein [Dokdonella sp.]|uniref:DUF7507 domain-containing protein n=1 Tax=Dokdonella sp. TaxID=2291710 RepID=UPI001B284012|nr:hypothetical protein [Dokdonella sp.]MBO9662257.1 DUF11 domain-containing protein [Dokdonella sp.]